MIKKFQENTSKKQLLLKSVLGTENASFGCSCGQNNQNRLTFGWQNSFPTRKRKKCKFSKEKNENKKKIAGRSPAILP